MLSNVYYGELKKSAKKNWVNINDPYEVLTDAIEIHISGWNFLDCADMYFSECHKCDWGSFAWKCSKSQLLKFQDEENCTIKGIELLDNNKIYGIVFIEAV